MGRWGRRVEYPPWDTFGSTLKGPFVHAGRLQSLSYDPQHDEVMDLNVSIISLRVSGLAKRGRPDGKVPPAIGVMEGAMPPEALRDPTAESTSGATA